MPKIYAYIVILILILGFIKWYSAKEYKAGYNEHKAETLFAIKDAVEIARADERTKQGEVNDALKKQYEESNAINANLNDDLDKLRQRASRDSAIKSNNTEPNCEGATGEHLSGEDAGFLTREAARADKIRSALKTCYTYADTVAGSVTKAYKQQQ